MGEALADLGGELLVKDVATGIEESISMGDEHRLALLVSGFLAYRAGFTLYKKYDAKNAISLLAHAYSDLERAQCPMAFRAAFFKACGNYHLDRVSQASAAFRDLWEKLDGLPYPTLRGHVAWMMGLTGMVLGDPVKAIHSYDQAQSFFRKAGELDNAISINSLLAERLDLLGRSREGWIRHYRSLQQAHQLRDPQLLYLIFEVAAQAALRQAGPVAAIDFQNEVVWHVSGSNPVLQSSSLYWRAFMYDLMNNDSKAITDLEHSREWNAKSSDPSIANSLDADITMIEAGLLLHQDPNPAEPEPNRGSELVPKQARKGRQKGRQTRSGSDPPSFRRVFARCGVRSHARWRLDGLSQPGSSAGRCPRAG